MFKPNVGLSLQNAQEALAEGLRAIAAGETDFNLSNASDIDSVAVAILLSWQRAAQHKGATLVFHNPPPALHSLAKLYGVNTLLQLDPDTGSSVNKLSL